MLELEPEAKTTDWVQWRQDQDQGVPGPDCGPRTRGPGLNVDPCLHMVAGVLAAPIDAKNRARTKETEILPQIWFHLPLRFDTPFP